MTRPAHRNRESGYALLFIYAMAAILAMMLLMAMPRVAFEAQRDKEQLLVDRGEQYSRAVALFVRKFNRYPPDLNALDNTQNLRFLRNHYVDPMTGKDEWRLIHVGPGGVFTDSLVYNQKKTNSDQAFAAQNFIMDLGQTGGNQTDPNQSAVNLATRQRPSDTPGGLVDPNNPQAGLLPLQPDGSQPGAPPTGNPIPVAPGLIQPGLPQFDVNGQPIPNTGTTTPGFPTQGQPGVNGLPQGVQLPPGLPMPPGTPNPLTGPNGTSSPAGTSLINQLLTTPRPGGLAGLTGAAGANGVSGQPAVDQNGNPIPAANQTTGTIAATTGQVVGGGVAGVASKREQEGIKVYHDKKKYNEWEFVYDITKDPTRTGGAVPTPGQGQPQQPGQAGQPGQQTQGQSPFGATQPQPQSQPTTPTTPPPSQ